jgi:opacity protein-like surface antigen
MVAWSTSFSPSYTFADSTRVSASASLNQELTISDGDDDPQTFLFGDIQFGMSRPIYKFEDGGPRISGSLSASIPTSDSSQASTLRTTLGVGIGLGQQLSERWSLSFNSAFRKNFHEYTSPVRDPRASSLVTRDGLAVVELSTGIARDGGPELRNESTYVEPGINNTSFSISNGIGLSYSATDKLGFGLNYQLSNSWTYESFPLDELSGVGAQGGRGRRDSHAASISVNYQLLDNLSLSGGVANGGATRTADDRRIRIPFLSFEGQELTMFSVGVTYTQPVPL